MFLSLQNRSWISWQVDETRAQKLKVLPKRICGQKTSVQKIIILQGILVWKYAFLRRLSKFSYFFCDRLMHFKEFLQQDSTEIHNFFQRSINKFHIFCNWFMILMTTSSWDLWNSWFYMKTTMNLEFFSCNQLTFLYMLTKWMENFRDYFCTLLMKSMFFSLHSTENFHDILPQLAQVLQCFSTTVR